MGFGINTEINEKILSHPYTNVGKVDSIVARLLLQEAYETAYGIHDHTARDSTNIHLQARKVKEQTFYYSQTDNEIRRYVSQDIYNLTGIPLDRFLELPISFVESIYLAALDKAKLKDASINSVVNQFQQK